MASSRSKKRYQNDNKWVWKFTLRCTGMVLALIGVAISGSVTSWCVGGWTSENGVQQQFDMLFLPWILLTVCLSLHFDRFSFYWPAGLLFPHLLKACALMLENTLPSNSFSSLHRILLPRSNIRSFVTTLSSVCHSAGIWSTSCGSFTALNSCPSKLTQPSTSSC